MVHRDQAHPPVPVAATRYIRPQGRGVEPVPKAYLASCDVHDKIHRGKIVRVRESILDELEDGESR